MTLEQRLIDLSTQLGLDHKSQQIDISSINTSIGTLSGLSTTAKTNLVSAINELYILSNNINDSATTGTTDKTYSVDKILSLISSLRQDLLGGVPAAAYDTLLEISDYISNDTTATSGLVLAVSNRVAYNQVQSLTASQKLQARTNIDAYGSVEIGDPYVNLLNVYNISKS
jgi:hypothetical protein